PPKNLSENMLFVGIEGENRRKATVRKVAIYESNPNWHQNWPDPQQFGNLPGYERGMKRYEDDVDWEAFTCTSSGGRNLKGTKSNPKNLRTAPQSKDQELVVGNLALKISGETKRPIHVIRGFCLDNEYASEEG
ncbi:12056_t:CDS:2, partial [Cetraspora pellucida]